ncbi:MAG: hypothetical protein ACOX7I_03390 [Oscillospiraceae bacterium]
MNYYAPNLISVCVDYVNYPYFGGGVYHCYSSSPVKFDGIVQLTNIMDAFFDSIRIPQAANKPRSFTPSNDEPNRSENEVQVMSIRDITNQRGEKATFIVHVQYRQNATWQGNVFWAEKNITRNFRSALELLKLIDSAFNDGSSQTFCGIEQENHSEHIIEEKEA